MAQQTNKVTTIIHSIVLCNSASSTTISTKKIASQRCERAQAWRHGSEMQEE